MSGCQSEEVKGVNKVKSECRKLLGHCFALFTPFTLFTP